MLTCADLVGPLGFEPRTCGLRVRCSAVELEARAVLRFVTVAEPKGPPTVSTDPTDQLCHGVTDGTRTRDFQGHILALYQLNYGHHELRTRW